MEGYSSDDELRMCYPTDEVLPYQFEPLPTNATFEESQPEEEFEQSIEPENGEPEENVRFDTMTMEWCDCENCEILSTPEECICCHEIEPVSSKMEELDIQKCITEHEGFIANCLNRYVIEVSLYEFVLQDGPIDDNEPINELYRHIAYRRFTKWIWHRLGKGRRKVIPSCAVRKIRNTFPSEQYTGFKYARPCQSVSLYKHNN